MVDLQEVYRAATMAWTVSQQDAQVCKQVLHSCNSFPPDAVEEVLQSSPICSQTQANSLCFRFKGQLQKLREMTLTQPGKKIKHNFGSSGKFCICSKLNSSVTYFDTSKNNFKHVFQLEVSKVYFKNSKTLTFFLIFCSVFFQLKPSSILYSFTSDSALLQTLCLRASFLHENN